MKEYIKIAICLLIAIILAPIIFRGVIFAILVLIAIVGSGLLYSNWKILESKLFRK